MPYTAKQAKFFQAVAHGMKPTHTGNKGLSEEEARKLAAEAKRTGQRKALREMK